MTTKICYLIIDTGVLLTDKAVLPGADSTVQKLRALGKKIGFVTNNTLYAVEKLQANLAQFDAKADEIVSPTVSLIEYLRKIDFQKDIYMISTAEPKRLVREAGYNVLEFKVKLTRSQLSLHLRIFLYYQDIIPEKVEPIVSAIFESQLISLQKCKNVGLVYLDYDMNYGYGDIQCAINIIRHIEGVQVLSGLNDDEIPSPNGALIGIVYSV